MAGLSASWSRTYKGKKNQHMNIMTGCFTSLIQVHTKIAILVLSEPEILATTTDLPCRTYLVSRETRYGLPEAHVPSLG